MVKDENALAFYILENSISNDIDEAWLEWEAINHNPRLKPPDIGEYYEHEGHCLCGVKIIHFYQIRNKLTGVIFPKDKYSDVGIGCICINTFMRGYRFPTYKKKSIECNRCGSNYIDTCKKCQRDHLRGIIYCLNENCKYKINKHTKKRYVNDLCKKCNTNES